MIQQLIDKQDMFEIIRDRIALIIANESQSQQGLALAAGKNPDNWKIRSYLERSNPWEMLQTDDGQPPQDESPIANVWFSNSNIDLQASDLVHRQQMNASYYIDVYGYAVTEKIAGGQIPGDEAAAKEAQRAAKLIRNILMSNEYVKLGFDGFDQYSQAIGHRYVSGIEMFQPASGANNAQKVVAARITLTVSMRELSPQNEGETLEEITIVTKNEDGQVLFNADYSY